MIKRIQFFFIIRKRRGTFYVTNVTKKCTYVTYHDNILVRIQWSFTSARKRFGTSGLSSVTDIAKLPLTAGLAPSFLIHTRDFYAENISPRRRHTEPIGPNGTASSLHFRNSADTLTSKFYGLLRVKQLWTNNNNIYPTAIGPPPGGSGPWQVYKEKIIISFQLINPSETKRNLLKDSVRTAL